MTLENGQFKRRLSLTYYCPTDEEIRYRRLKCLQGHLGEGTAVQLVYSHFSQFVSQLELYTQLQLSLQSDPIALSVPIST